MNNVPHNLLSSAELASASNITNMISSHYFAHVPTIQKLLSADETIINDFQAYWANLSKDKYVEGYTNRFRRMVRFDSTEHGLTINNDNTVKTSTKYNPISGGLVREYLPASEEFINNQYFQKILNFNNTIARSYLPHKELVVSCHLFRIAPASDQNDAKITIGKHKDDTELVCLHFINGSNFSGGESSLYDNDGNIVPNSTVTLSQPGESIYIDDIKLLHETTAINKIDSNQDTFRDVLLFMINSKEKHIENHN